MKDFISLIAPIYNEELSLREFYKQVSTNLVGLDVNYEIVFIDDGSVDESIKILKEIVKLDTKVRVLKFSKNFGHHYAISAGLSKARGNYAIVMDTDLQDDPRVIKELINSAREGNDIVFVNRIKRTDSLPYRLLQRIFYIVLNLLSGLNFDHRQANFSIINRKVIDAFNSFPEATRFYVSTIKWLGFKTSSVDAKHQGRFKGKPSYSFDKRVKLAIDIIISFSDRPLRFAIYFGLGISILAFLASAYIVYIKIMRGYEIQGWTSIITATTFFSGINLTVLGIIGIYIGKIFKEVKRRPLYIISEIIN